MLIINGNSVSAGGGGGTEVGTITKNDGSLLLRSAQDYADLNIPAIPLFNQVSAAGTELPDGPKTAQGGTSTTITLAANASSVDGYYVGQRIYQTANKENRLCTAYNGTTKVATVSPAWTTTPTGSTGYDIFMNCHERSNIRVKCTFSAPLQNGAFMKSFIFVKLYDDDNLSQLIGRLIEPMSMLEATYAVTGSFLSPTPPILESGRAVSNVVDLPVVKGAKNYKLYLSGGVYQCNTWSAPATPNTIVTSGNITVFTAAV